MKRRMMAAGGLCMMLAGCSPLLMFNAAVPKDRGGVRIARDLAYGSDPRQRFDLYGPHLRPAHPLPILVFFYGGSWNSGTKDGYGFVGRALAARGFLVAIPDYRLVPQVRYPAFIEDGAAAVKAIRATAARFGGDGDRLILAGHSAGAYNAAMLALDRRWLGADRRFVRGLIGLAGPYDFLPFDGAVVEQAFAGVGDPTFTQPVTHVGTDSPPAFLATGDEDETVLPRNSDRLAARLAAAGVAVERRRYPNIGHAGLVTAIARPLRRRAPVLGDMVAFAERVTVPR